jgi:hypothetical protein
LPDGCSIRCVAASSDILDPDGDDVAATKLAVDCQIEHCEVASAALDLELCPDGPDVFGPQRRLRSCQLSFVPRHSLGRGTRIHLIHSHTPRLGYRGEKHELLGAASKSSLFEQKQTLVPSLAAGAL